MPTSDQIQCCPRSECGSARIQVFPGGYRSEDSLSETRYRCKECGHRFDEPAEREREHSGGARRGLAGELAARGERGAVEIRGGES